MMRRAYLLSVSAVFELVTGLGLLAFPAAVLNLLLGIEEAAVETTLVARVTGAALFAIGLVAWFDRHRNDRPSQRGLLLALLVYDVAAAVILANAGLALNLSGVALWPAVMLHSVLAVWCIFSLRMGGNVDTIQPTAEIKDSESR